MTESALPSAERESSLLSFTSFHWYIPSSFSFTAAVTQYLNWPAVSHFSRVNTIPPKRSPLPRYRPTLTFTALPSGVMPSILAIVSPISEGASL